MSGKALTGPKRPHRFLVKLVSLIVPCMMNRSKLTTIAGKLSVALALFFGVSAFAQVPRSKHVYIVAEENRSYEQIVGSTSMPYLNSLLAKGGVATQFYSNMHGSLENYLILTSGQYLTAQQRHSGGLQRR